jgi:hypothetical protein
MNFLYLCVYNAQQSRGKDHGDERCREELLREGDVIVGGVVGEFERVGTVDTQTPCRRCVPTRMLAK